MKLSCQNGCDDFLLDHLRKPTVLIKELATGEIRAFCWKCLVRISKITDNSGIELKPEFENWGME